MTDRPTPASDETDIRSAKLLANGDIWMLYANGADTTMSKLIAAAVQAESRKLLDELIVTAKMTGTLTAEDLTLIRDRHFTLLDSEQQKLGGKNANSQNG